MILAEMIPIEMVYEAVRGDFVYRVTVAATGNMIKRANVDHPTWHHGVLTCAYDRGAEAFLPMIKARDVLLPDAVTDAVLASL